jgi:quinol monooxygenase YgiN
VIVLSRFRVPPSDAEGFRQQAEAAMSVLQGMPGLVSIDLARNLDEPELWTVTSRWQDVGSYRRALQGFEARSVAVPLLSRAIDEPSAYERPDLVGENLARNTEFGPDSVR